MAKVCYCDEKKLQSICKETSGPFTGWQHKLDLPVGSSLPRINGKGRWVRDGRAS